MNSDHVAHENERYFPNHRLDREIGLAEYNAAANRLSNDERALSWSTNASVLLATAVGYISLNSASYVEGLSSTGIDPGTFRLLLLAAIVAFGFFSILHLASLFKSLVFAERKIVVLRRMLGVSYGDSSLVLPSWRVEGASNPFSLRLFPGYFAESAFPVHVVLLTTSLSVFVLSVGLSAELGAYIPYFENHPQRMQISAAALWYAFGLFVFRRNLREANENSRLTLARQIAKIFRVKFVPNFEDSLYRLRIEIAEMIRIKTDTGHARKLAIFIEDRDFFEHRGINWRGIARALLGRLRGKSRGGGSSITQQLARSHFIVRPSNTIGRKLTEMLLARWLETCLSKDEILLGYLSTVRFESSIYGFHRAYRHFFLAEARATEKWEAFLLIERLGNIRRKFLGRRVRQLLTDAVDARILSKDDALLSLGYYSSMVGTHFDLNENDLTPDEVTEDIKKLA